MLFEFHHKHKQPIARPWADVETWNDRMKFIMEEYEELAAEWEIISNKLASGDIPNTADMARFLKEMCDCEYVLRGTGVAFGLPHSQAFSAVHASNMTKAVGKPGGKVPKGPDYEPPNLIPLSKPSLNKPLKVKEAKADLPPPEGGTK